MDEISIQIYTIHQRVEELTCRNVLASKSLVIFFTSLESFFFVFAKKLFRLLINIDKWKASANSCNGK